MGLSQDPDAIHELEGHVKKRRSSVFVSVLEGETPEEMRPILMTRDSAILHALADAVRQRLLTTESSQLVRQPPPQEGNSSAPHR